MPSNHARKSPRKRAPRRPAEGFPLQRAVAGYLERLLAASDPDLNLVLWVWRMLPSEIDCRVTDLLVGFARKHFKPRTFQALTADEPSGGSLIHEFFRNANEEKIPLGRLCRPLRQIWADHLLASGAGDEPPSSGGTRALRKLGDVLGLAPEELRVIEFVFCQERNEPMSGFCRELDHGAYLRCLSAATGASEAVLKKALAGSGRLLATGILTRDYCPPPHYALSSGVAEVLSGSEEMTLVNKTVVKDGRSTHPLASFPVTAMQTRICRSLLAAGRPSQLLLHGSPGTGKTEFARSLARAAGRQAWFLAYPEEDKLAARRLALHLAVRLLSPQNGLLIVDEADSLLNTEHPFHKAGDKGWLTGFLDRSPVPTVWISNSVEETHEAILRRFAYSLSFKPFTPRERLGIWQAVRRGHPLRRHLPDRLVRDLAARYRVSAGGVASVLQSLAAIYDGSQEPSAEEVRGTLQELLARHAEVTGAPPQQVPAAPKRSYDLGLLNTAPSAAELLEALRTRPVSPAAPPASETGEEERGLNLLFWGPPGTGKTEFARHLASRLHLELLVRRASDLQSRYVGDTEKAIRRAFEEAARERAILFLDEADSFFADRRFAQHSWEASQTNELLTWMENHAGLLICATNLLDRLDPASLRRFAWKVEFKPLAAQARERAFRRYFPLGRRRLAPELAARLARIPGLTLGDLHAVRERGRWGAAEREGVDHGRIVADLEREAALRGGGEQRRAGFTA